MRRPTLQRASEITCTTSPRRGSSIVSRDHACYFLLQVATPDAAAWSKCAVLMTAPEEVNDWLLNPTSPTGRPLLTAHCSLLASLKTAGHVVEVAQVAALGRAYSMYADPYDQPKHQASRFTEPGSGLDIAGLLKATRQAAKPLPSTFVKLAYCTMADYYRRHPSDHPGVTLLEPMPDGLSARLRKSDERELTKRLGPALQGTADFLLPIELQMTGGGKHWVVLRGSRGTQGFRVCIFNSAKLLAPEYVRTHLKNLASAISGMNEWRTFGRKEPLGGAKQTQALELVTVRAINSNTMLSGDCALRMVLWRDSGAEKWQTMDLGCAEEGDNWLYFRSLLLSLMLGGGASNHIFQELVRIAPRDLQLAP
jgi:hypothetical protein